MADESRELRGRLADIEERAARLLAADLPQSYFVAGQVYNAGSIPTTVPAFYATHPVEIAPATTEGGTATSSVDTTRTVLIRAIGPAVPVVGDYLLGQDVPWRFEAWRGTGGGGGPPSGWCSCSGTPPGTLCVTDALGTILWHLNWQLIPYQYGSAYGYLSAETIVDPMTGGTARVTVYCTTVPIDGNILVIGWLTYNGTYYYCDNLSTSCVLDTHFPPTGPDCSPFYSDQEFYTPGPYGERLPPGVYPPALYHVTDCSSHICSSTNVCFTLQDCDGSRVSGATFTAASLSCTTDGSGQCCITVSSLVEGSSLPWSASYTDPVRGLQSWSGTLIAGCATNHVAEVMAAANVVTITVYDACHSDPKAPCPFATVMLDGTTWTTDGSGQITLTNVTGGVIPIDVAGCGCQPYSGTITVTCTGAQSFEVDLVCLTTCELVVTVTGCNGLPLPAAAVSWNGGPTYSTDGNGIALLPGLTPGTGPLVVTCARFASYSASVTVSGPCPQIVNASVALTPATGYHCTACSVIPLKDTIYVTDGQYGVTATCTYGGGGYWYGTASASYPGSACCPASTFTLEFSFTNTCSLSVAFTGSGGTYGCPQASGYQGVTSVTVASKAVPLDCSGTPGWLFTFVAPPKGCIPLPGTPNDNPLYPDGGNWLVTET